MFDRFTKQARQVLVLAQKEACALKHHYIGTEHILLGLLREEEGLGARVLERLDITVEGVRALVVLIAGSGEEEVVSQRPLPFTPRTKRVLDFALREALRLGHYHVDTEHILLGLVCLNEGLAARVLLELEADSEKILVHLNEGLTARFLLELEGDSEKIRNELIATLSAPGGEAGAKPEQPGTAAVPHAVMDEGASRLMQIVAPQIAQHLGRPPDAGDLLLALASVPDGLAARTLATLGVDLAALTRAATEARREAAPCGTAGLAGQIEKMREPKAAASDGERQLADSARELDEQRLALALSELRDRLALTDT